MSKLYDVISRLEEVAEQDSALAREDEAGQDTVALNKPSFAKQRFPLTRILVMAALVVLLGVLVVVAVFWWRTLAVQPAAPDNMDITIQSTALLSEVSEPEPPAVEELAVSEEVPAAADSPVLPEQENQENKGLEDDEIAQKVETPALSLDPSKETKLQPEVQGDSTIAATTSSTDRTPAAKKKIFVKIHKLKELDEHHNTDELQSGKTFIAPVTTTDIFAKTGRWLHQAELYRHQGDWESAISLYKKVFTITKDPAVANNLAAALIQLHRLEEAHAILEEAGRMAPDDPDIEQNLKVIKQKEGKR